jgi:hypothetical protein
MRKLAIALFLSTMALSALVPTAASSAASGHYYCTSDGIKSWTTDADKKDGRGWTYSGDRATYGDSGKCTKA